MLKILLTGGNGMLGKDAIPILEKANFSVLSPSSTALDISNIQLVNNFFKENHIDLIINTAAYTKVDLAEQNPEQAFLVNEIGTLNLAIIAQQKNIQLIHISTDYVFDGTQSLPYLPTSQTNPINVYGKSKLAAEQAIINNCSNFYIARTSWLYGLMPHSFVSTILSLAKTKNDLKIVNDQIGCPTFTYELIRGILTLIQQVYPYGIYHICGSGYTSWYAFANKIFELSGIEIITIPITTEEFLSNAKNSTARRPQYSVMDNQNSCVSWDIALREYLKLKGLLA